MGETIDRLARGVLNLMLVTALPFVVWLYAAPLL